jgi:ABC-type dipeptide/oligopeptide/nickel transport system permease subunit
MVIFPAVAISSLVLGLSLLADGLEEVSKRLQGRAA